MVQRLATVAAIWQVAFLAYGKQLSCEVTRQHMLALIIDSSQLQFACDAMLGGLARWLRAAGYDSSWKADVGDWELVRLSLREGRILLSSDTGIFRIGIVRDAEVPALFVPHGLSKQEQLVFFLGRL